MSDERTENDLRRRASRRGIVVDYTDALQRRRRVASPTLDALLDLLDDRVERSTPPEVVLAWDGITHPRTPRRWTSDATVVAESGEELGGADLLDEGAPPLPLGVHAVVVAQRVVGRIIAAPTRPAGDASGSIRPWGLFAPAYAIRDARGRPAGDVTSLEQLALSSASLGASALATLPLLAELATADGGARRQQPYSPLSRMFWNEGYLDPQRIPELEGDLPIELEQHARSVGLRGPVAEAEVREHADLGLLAAELRPLLDEAVRRVERLGGERLAAFERYLDQRTELARYCGYRAAAVAGGDRSGWSAAWRSGHFDDVPALRARRHAFAQFEMDEQLAASAARLADAGTGLIMDLPIGCSASGYDPWAFPDVYVNDASIGAPPDIFFSAGQQWGFPPPHPDVDRRNGYPVLRACLAHSLRHASVLRVDHILGWSRLWWIPSGMGADEGAYVRYPFDELLAIANLEASRLGATLVGEDLGTVERGMRSKLAKRGVSGMSVAVFDLSDHPGRRLRPPDGAYAYVDTHDTATFAGWLSGADIELREELGLLDADAADTERKERDAARTSLTDRVARRRRRARPRAHGEKSSPALDAAPETDEDETAEIFTVVLEELGHSEAACVLVAYEDLWGELDPQNVPGTTGAHENFSRRFTHTSEQLADDEQLRAPLVLLDQARRR